MMDPIDPAEADFMGFGPRIGHPVYHLPDGRRVAISICDFGLLWTFGPMTYEIRQGVGSWSIFNPRVVWTTIDPDPGHSPDDTLSVLVARAGGPRGFILAEMKVANDLLCDYLGFNPQWPTGQALLEAFSGATKAWGIKPLIASDPLRAVLAYPR